MNASARRMFISRRIETVGQEWHVAEKKCQNGVFVI